jgi:hypothetical protein
MQHFNLLLEVLKAFLVFGNKTAYKAVKQSSVLRILLEEQIEKLIKH